MRLSIQGRMILAMNLLVAAVGAAVGVAGIHVAGRQIEDRLIHQAVANAAALAQQMHLPLSPKLMSDLGRILDAQVCAGPAGSGNITASSLDAPQAQDFASQIAGAAPATVRLGGRVYHVGRAQLVSPPPQDQPMTLYLLVDDERVRGAKVQVAVSIVAVTLAAVLGATAVGFLLARSISRPLRRLGKRMDALAANAAAGGSLEPPTDVRASAKGPAELVGLAQSFGRLVDELDRARRRLARSERLSAMGRMSASVAHELRNPLSGIKMNARVLRDELAGRGQSDPSLEIIIREIDRMDLYLQELLTAGREEKGDRLLFQASSASRSSTNTAGSSPRPDPPNGNVACPLFPAGATDEQTETASLAEAATSVLALLEARCRHAGVTVDKRFGDGDWRVSAPADKVRQVVMNLVINALEAMPHGGRLTITVGKAATAEKGDTQLFLGPALLPPRSGDGSQTQQNGSCRAGKAECPLFLRLSVSDAGGGVVALPGVDVFEPLVTTKAQGVGLGLYVCKQIVESAGGRIGYMTGPSGSTFWFELPGE